MMKDGLGERWPRVAEIPFTSERKRMTTHPRGRRRSRGHRRALARQRLCGLLPRALSTVAGYVRPGLGRRRDRAAGREDARSASLTANRRVRPSRASACSEWPSAGWTSSRKRWTRRSWRADLTFVGMVGMIDPARPEVKEAVADVPHRRHPAGHDHRRSPADRQAHCQRAAHHRQDGPSPDRARSGQNMCDGDCWTSSVGGCLCLRPRLPGAQAQYRPGAAGAEAMSWP